MLTFGSLFSGIGGIDLGLERAGMQCAWQVEIDDYATKVLQKHWPNVTRFRDIRDCGKHNLTPVDLIAGGFPCQPHSLAGKRQASSDERDLWGEFYRIICELKPTWIVAENVPGLLSSESGRFFGRILRDLAEVGYDAEWRVFSAAEFGAPHLRERIFIIAYINSIHMEKPILEKMQRRSSLQPMRIHGCNPSSFAWKTYQPELVGMDDGLSDWLHRSKGLGNAVIPPIPEYVGRCILASSIDISQPNIQI